MNDRRRLWGKLLSSMIRYRLNVTIVIDQYGVTSEQSDSFERGMNGEMV